MNTADPKVRAIVARNIAVELWRIRQELTELQADAETINFHAASIRIARLNFLCDSTACGLKQQAGKLDVGKS